MWYTLPQVYVSNLWLYQRYNTVKRGCSWITFGQVMCLSHQNVYIYHKIHRASPEQEIPPPPKYYNFKWISSTPPRNRILKIIPREQSLYILYYAVLKFHVFGWYIRLLKQLHVHVSRISIFNFCMQQITAGLRT